MRQQEGQMKSSVR